MSDSTPNIAENSPSKSEGQSTINLRMQQHDNQQIALAHSLEVHQSDLNNQDGEELLYLIYKYMSIPQQLDLRAVKQLPKVTSNEFGRTVVFHVNGKHPKSLQWMNLNPLMRNAVHPALETLLNSELSYPNIKFSNFDLQRELIENMNILERFIYKICGGGLKSLVVENVACSLGRFIELLVFCKYLEALEILHSSCLLTMDPNISAWELFIPRLRIRLFKLKRFKIMCKNVNFESIYPYLGFMRSLVSLDLQTTDPNGNLPLNYIMEIISLNSSSLKRLSLVGNCTIDEEHCPVFNQLNLEFLRLGRLEGININLNTVIIQHKNLTKLHFIGVKLLISSIRKILLLEHLEQLFFYDVVLEGYDDVFHQCPITVSCWSNIKHLQILTRNGTPNSIWNTLFHKSSLQTLYHLRTLCIQLNNAPSLLKKMPFLMLRELKYVFIKGVTEDCEEMNSFVHKLSNLKKLESIEIVSSKISDNVFERRKRNLVGMDSIYYTFTKCLSLTLVNLSGTSIGDMTLIQVISPVPNLKKVYVNRTLVSLEGLLKFKMKRRDASLPNVQEIYAFNCIKLTGLNQLWINCVKCSFGDVKFFC